MTLQSSDPRSLDLNPNAGWPVVSPLWRRYYAMLGATSGGTAFPLPKFPS